MPRGKEALSDSLTALSVDVVLLLQICNCNCLPILPLERCMSCNALSKHQQVDEDMHNNGQPCSSACSQDSGDEDMTGFDPANAGLVPSH